ncbi:MAG: PIG-L family deacetylase [Planctomycetota bacterium]
MAKLNCRRDACATRLAAMRGICCSNFRWSNLLLGFLLMITAAAEELLFEHGLELIRNELLLARTGIRVLVIAAHPDDEDSGTLSYLRRALNVETHLCLCAHGEGELNENKSESAPKLAVTRAREIEAACEILGAKAWYLNLPDFGYSKSREETLKIWGHEQALAKLVRVMRLARPHIILVNHDPDDKDNGQHCVAEELAREAFEVAADSTRFSEQLKEDGMLPWAATKLYLRCADARQATIRFDLSPRDPLTGLSAAEIGARVLARRIGQSSARRWKIGEKEWRYFTLLKSHASQAVEEKTLLDGIPPLTTVELQRKIDEALKQLQPAAAADGALALAILVALSTAQSNPDSVAHLQEALIESLGIKTEVTVSDAVTTYNEPVVVKARVANTGPLPLTARLQALLAESPYWDLKFDQTTQSLASGAVAEFEATVTAQSKAYPTFPLDQYSFDRFQSRPPLRVELKISLQNPKALDACVEFTLRRPVPLNLALPLESSITPNPVLVFDDPAHGDDFLALARFRMVVTNRRRLDAPLKLFCGIQPQDTSFVDRWATLQFHNEDEVCSEEFRCMASVDKLNQGDVAVPTAVWTADKNFGGPVAHIRRVPIKLPPRLAVGLVKTSSDAVFDALKLLENAGLGLTLDTLSDDDLRTADLNKYHTVILDARATHDRPQARHARERLMEFMKFGGNVLCLYHQDDDWNSPTEEMRGEGERREGRGEGRGGDIAPYTIELSSARITDENAPVRILMPEHPLLREPCHIWERDFKDWVRERGVCFPKKWASEYAALLSCHDPGEIPLEGGLLVADVGRGSFIYTSYAWHHQLRAGVIGAYRLLANLISYSRVKQAK